MFFIGKVFIEGLAVIIMNFAVPFVNKSLSGTDCFEVIGQVEITNNEKYNCFAPDGGNSSEGNLRLQVHIGDINDSLSGFLVELGGASTKSVQIKNGNINEDGVMMFGNEDNASLEVPGKNEERTYIIKEVLPDVVRVYPLLKDGKVCDTFDSLESISLCSE